MNEHSLTKRGWRVDNTWGNPHIPRNVSQFQLYISESVKHLQLSLDPQEGSAEDTATDGYCTQSKTFYLY